MASTNPYRSRSLPRSVKQHVQYPNIRSFHSLHDFSSLQNGADYRHPPRWQSQTFYPPSYRVPKGLLLTFFHNGDPFSAGVKVSIRPGKDFQSLLSFCDYLTQKLKVPYGVRYVFDIEDGGRTLRRLDEFRDGESYVVSSTRHFIDIAYGLSSRMRTAFTTSRPTFLRPDDMRLLRPPTPAHLRHYRGNTKKLPEHIYFRGQDQSIQVRTVFSESGPAVGPTAGYKDGRIMTIVNGLNHAVRSRVLLNLKTTKNYEGVLRDLGQAVGLPNPTRMYTPWGQEVLSFSNLKVEYKDVETFYLDDIDPKLKKKIPTWTRIDEPEILPAIFVKSAEIKTTETKSPEIETKAPEIKSIEAPPETVEVTTNQEDIPTIEEPKTEI